MAFVFWLQKKYQKYGSDFDYYILAWLSFEAFLSFEVYAALIRTKNCSVFAKLFISLFLCAKDGSAFTSGVPNI